MNETHITRQVERYLQSQTGAEQDDCLHQIGLQAHLTTPTAPFTPADRQTILDWLYQEGFLIPPAAAEDLLERVGGLNDAD